MKKFLLIVISGIVLAGCAPSSVLRYPPSRWVRDNDRIPIAQPKERWRYSYAVGESERTQLAAFEKAATLMGPPKFITGGAEEAQNTDNFDEAPDSTWFTNRLGRFEMTPAEIAKGSGSGTAPTAKDVLEVVWVGRPKVVPEIIVEDNDGNRYLLIFDKRESPESSTSAAVISNRMLFAFGYNVPESYIVNIDREKLVMSPYAVTTTKYDEEIPATAGDLDRLWGEVAANPKTELARAAMLSDVDGIPAGPFSFSGRRSGDTNDRVRHEFMRELRGLRTFCAFLDCAAMVDEQTGDFFITTDGDKGYLMHYILHTDSTLGALQKSADEVKYNPGSWNPFFPNAAFNSMTKRDAFWASARLSRLSDDAIRAVVGEAKYADKGRRDAAISMLIERKNITIEYWFRKMSPLTDFALTKNAGGLLMTFNDLAGGNVYRYRITTDRRRAALKDWTDTAEGAALIENDLTARMLPKRLYVVEIQAKKPEDKWWLPSVDVFLKRTGPDEITLMGIARRYR